MAAGWSGSSAGVEAVESGTACDGRVDDGMATMADELQVSEDSLQVRFTNLVVARLKTSAASALMILPLTSV